MFVTAILKNNESITDFVHRCASEVENIFRTGKFYSFIHKVSFVSSACSSYLNFVPTEDLPKQKICSKIARH